LFETAALLESEGVPRWRSRRGGPMPLKSSSTRVSMKARRSGRKRRAAGGVPRAGEPPRPRQQHLQGPGVARPAGHAGRLHRDRLQRTAFLHASDIFDPQHADIGIEQQRTENIRALLAEGNEILVQVVKDPLGTKGARSRPTSRCRRATSCTCRRAAGWAFRRASRTKPSASGCAARSRRPWTPRKTPATSCAPRRKARAPRPCSPTCNTCADCGSSCGKRACAPSPEIWCTAICRCTCDISDLLRRTSNGC